MASYISADIKCPFYMNDNSKTCKLTCEGIPPGSTISSHFLNGAALREQISRRCAGEYEGCPWFRLLWGKYEV